MAFSDEIRQVYSTEIFSNTATMREVNSTEIDPVLLNIFRERHRITRHYSAELQTTKQTLATSKILIEFTYGDMIPPAVEARMRKFRPLQGLIRLQDLLVSARSRAEKKINRFRPAQRRSSLVVKYPIKLFTQGKVAF